MYRTGAVLALLLLAAAAHSQSAFTEIPGPAGELSWARDVSGDGTTVVGAYRLADGETQGFRWRLATGLETLGGVNSDAHAASMDGSVVVGQADNVSGVTEPFRWTSAGGLVSLGVLDGGTGIAFGVSGDGAVVVGESGRAPTAEAGCSSEPCELGDPGTVRAFQWTQGSGITPFGGFSNFPLSQATGISADGVTVVGNEYTYSPTQICFLQETGACLARRSLDAPLRSLSGAPAEVPFALLPGDVVANVSADGATIVGRDLDFSAFAWSEANGFDTLDREPYSFTVARDASGDGAIVVGDLGIARDGRIASLKNLLVNIYGLDVLGWTLDEGRLNGGTPVFGGIGATGISDDGQNIAGVGISPLGIAGAFHVALDAAPTTADFDALPQETEESAASAVLPNGRSGQVGIPLRVFASAVNPADVDLVGCGVVLGTPVAADFSFQLTDAATNNAVGSPDVVFDVPAFSSQSLQLSFTPTAEFAPDTLRLLFDCSNTQPDEVVRGLNDLILSASTAPTADVVAVATTMSGEGIVRTMNGMGAFAVGAVNRGPTQTLTVAPLIYEPLFLLGATPDDIVITVCQTDVATGLCTGPVAESITADMATDELLTFAVFVELPPENWLIPDWGRHRIQIHFSEDTGEIRGATSVALDAPPPFQPPTQM